VPIAEGKEESVENRGREYHGIYVSLSHVGETQNCSLSLAGNTVLAGPRIQNGRKVRKRHCTGVWGVERGAFS
jgi:hypothetical protein